MLLVYKMENIILK